MGTGVASYPASRAGSGVYASKLPLWQVYKAFVDILLLCTYFSPRSSLCNKINHILVKLLIISLAPSITASIISPC